MIAPDDDGFWCVFCSRCQTLMLWREAVAGRCCQAPARRDCPFRLADRPRQEAPRGV